mgnify:CR=1 FL=1
MTELNLPTAKPTATPSWLARLTLGDLLLFLLLCAAAILRLANLGAIPLSPSEAEQALAVWLFWSPEVTTAPSTSAGQAASLSPAYFTFSSLLLQIMPDSDAAMRLVPVLFGLSLIFLPWLLRHQLGSVGALTTSFLLAVSPLQTAVSRTASGDAIALFCLMLLYVSWQNYCTTGKASWLFTLAIAVGLGLTSAPLFYTGLLPFVVVLLAGLFGKPLPNAEADEMKTAVILLVTTFAASATALLLNPAGLGDTARLLASWLAGFTAAPFQGSLNTLLTLLRYEILIVTFSLVAIIWLVATSQKTSGSGLLLWAGGVLVLLLIQQGTANAALVLVLPLALLAGEQAAVLLRRLPSRAAIALAIGLFVAGLLFVGNFLRFTRQVAFNAQALSGAWIAILIFCFAVITIYFVWTVQETAAYQGAWLGLLSIMFVITWGTGWQLTQRAANDPRERWVQQATDDDLFVIVNMLEDVSHEATRTRNGLEIFSTVDTPTMRWYLRNFENATIGSTLPQPAGAAVLLTSAITEPQSDQPYVGIDFSHTRQPTVGAGSATVDRMLRTIRWWAFHETTAVFNEERLVLWLRADLIAPEGN